MKHLTEIIKNLSKVEKRHFRIFSNRVIFKGGKKVIQLYDSLLRGKFEEDSPELIRNFFPDFDKNNYYRLKNRLLTDLLKSLVAQHAEIDSKNEIIHMVTAANIFIHKNLYKQAFYYLLKAEKKAEKNELYALLDFIYSEIIIISKHYDVVDPSYYSSKRKSALKKFSLIREAEEIVLAINHKLRKTNFSGKDIDIQPMLKKITDELEINKEIYRLSSVQLRINECVRSNLLQAKKFILLENYLLSSYKKFEQLKFFNQKNHLDKLVLISWIINAYSKNRKFKTALLFADKLFIELKKYNMLFYKKYSWVYFQGLAVNKFYTGKIDEAMTITQNLLNDTNIKENQFYELGIFLTLSSQYYCKGDISKAIQVLKPVLVKECYNQLPPNWRLNVSIIEVIFHYEKGDLDFAYNKLKAISRNYKKELKQPLYSSESNFIDLFNSILKTPDPFKTPKIKTKITQYLTAFPQFEPGSNEVINYAIWLTSKLNDEDYYQVILKKLKE